MTDPILADAAAVFTPSISERRSSTTTYFHNGFKNAESQTIANETVSATQTFDAFGLPDTSSGTWKGPFAYGGPYGYQSDSDSGLMLLGHRYYDASTGRFLSRDPAKDGRNWYAYCDGNALNQADPNGLLKITIGAGGGVFGGPATGSVNFGFVIDTDDFLNSGFEAGVSGGPGVGLGATVGPSVDLNWGSPSTSTDPSVLQLALPFLTLNMSPDNFGIGTPANVGGGLYVVGSKNYRFTLRMAIDDAKKAQRVIREEVSRIWPTPLDWRRELCGPGN